MVDDKDRSSQCRSFQLSMNNGRITRQRHCNNSKASINYSRVVYVVSIVATRITRIDADLTKEEIGFSHTWD